jgi:hypothetical protein
MQAQKRTMIWINLVGGLAVLGSYAHGFLTHPGSGSALWGGVPQAAQPLYTVNMFLAAAGYLAFTAFLLFAVDAQQARVAGRFGYGLFCALHVGILLPSALWMPLTYRMLDRPSQGLWWAIRLVLALVGASSLGLLGALLALRPRRPGWAHALAVLGCVDFCLQTVVLDALIWPAVF